MPTQILSTAATDADSSDVTVANGSTLTVALKGAGGHVPAGSRVNILLKDDAGVYHFIDRLDEISKAKVIGPGTYRFTRIAGGSCGVFSG